MNILPKKNWHVRKKENIARVRRDEAEAAEKEKEKERRAKLAEQEARVALLRRRARERDGFNLEDDEDPSPVSEPSETTKTEADIFTSSGNINFFKDAEAGLAETGTNKEYVAEKKAEKEDYEKKIGLLTYLGQDTLEAQGKTAWFNEREHIITKKSLDEGQENEVGLKSKSKMDPLNDIKKYTNFSTYPKNEDSIAVRSSPKHFDKVKSKNLCRKDKKHKKERMKKRKRKRSSSTESDSEIKKKKKKKHSKKKKRRRDSSEEEEEEEGEDCKAPSHDLAKLREERLKREALERKRADRLLAGKDPDVEEKDPKKDLPYIQKYNSQFNPQIARQNQDILKVQPTLQAGVKYWLN